MAIFELDKNIGIGFYGTKTPGIKGKIKNQIEDFIVEEIDPDMFILRINKDENIDLGKKQKYIHFTLVKEGLDTTEALRILSSKTNIPTNFFSYAGLKDKKAITAQKISVYGKYYDNIKNFKHNKIRLKEFHYSQKPINIGDLWGNSFKIKIILSEKYDSAVKKINLISKEIKQNRGIPNFFGYQRFGTKRTVNHIIGKLLIKKQIKEAVLTFLFKIGAKESDKNKNIRSEISKKFERGDIKDYFPTSLIYEKIILKHLSKKPDDYLGAFLKLPKDILKLFIHSYQSYLFNLFITERRKINLPFNQAVEGDIIEIYNKDFPKYVVVTKENLDSINKEIDTRKVRIVYPILGYDSKMPGGEIFDSLNKIILKEKIKIEDFFFNDVPNLSNNGSYRNIVSEINNFSFMMNENAIFIDFSLEKGCYATTLIREILKKEDISDF